MTEASPHTFVFADLAGFTALTEAHGDEQAAELAADFCDTVRELLPEYGAEEVKTIGDAVMLRCDEPGAAVELGLRLVDEVGARP
jgi:adenylate cyclase